MGDISIDAILKYGELLVHWFWLPLINWSLISVLILFLLKRSKKITASYQYQIRKILVYLLPLVLIVSYFVELVRIPKLNLYQPVGELLSSETSASFLNTQVESLVFNPPQKESFNFVWSDFLWDINLWSFILFCIVTLMAVYGLFKWLYNQIAIERYAKRLLSIKPSSLDCIDSTNLTLIKGYDKYINFCFINENCSPSTFGYFNPVIVFPEHYLLKPSNFNIALRHELVHIYRKDYLHNNFMELVKALFHFNPVVHKLVNSTSLYREMLCDAAVLSHDDIKAKEYALLLHEQVQQRPKTIIMAMSSIANELKDRLLNIKSYNNRWELILNYSIPFVSVFALVTIMLSSFVGYEKHTTPFETDFLVVRSVEGDYVYEGDFDINLEAINLLNVDGIETYYFSSNYFHGSELRGVLFDEKFIFNIDSGVYTIEPGYVKNLEKLQNIKLWVRKAELGHLNHDSEVLLSSTTAFNRYDKDHFIERYERQSRMDEKGRFITPNQSQARLLRSIKDIITETQLPIGYKYPRNGSLKYILEIDKNGLAKVETTILDFENEVIADALKKTIEQSYFKPAKDDNEIVSSLVQLQIDFGKVRVLPTDESLFEKNSTHLISLGTSEKKEIKKEARIYKPYSNRHLWIDHKGTQLENSIHNKRVLSALLSELNYAQTIKVMVSELRDHKASSLIIPIDEFNNMMQLKRVETLFKELCFTQSTASSFNCTIKK